MSKIVSAPVAGAVQAGGGKVAHLWHAIEIDERGNVLRVLCSRVKAEHILDDAFLYDTQSITCPTCLRATARAR